MLAACYVPLSHKKAPFGAFLLALRLTLAVNKSDVVANCFYLQGLCMADFDIHRDAGFIVDRGHMKRVRDCCSVIHTIMREAKGVACNAAYCCFNCCNSHTLILTCLAESVST